jgi:hypothetical protein
MRRRARVAALVLLCALTACTEDDRDPQARPGTPPTPATSPPDQVPTLPEGWRWESYRDVEVGVPGDWGYTNAERVDQQCNLAPRAVPAIGRPGGKIDLSGCRGPLPQVDPGALVANAGTFVALLPTSETVIEEGDRTVLIPDAVTQVVIQAGPGLREKIAATVHRIPTVDHNGCPIHHPIAEDPSWRPTPVDVATLTDIDAVRACRYTPLAPAEDAGPTVSLYSSLRLDGAGARAALAGIAAVPKVSRSNRPDSCSDGFGSETIVLQALRGATLAGEVVIRYAGCDDHGFDDGVRLRTVTAGAITPFLGQPNVPFSYSRAMAPVLRPAIRAAEASRRPE